MKSIAVFICLLICLSCVPQGFAETVTLPAAKDAFGRSNERNTNSGASPDLYVAHSPMFRALVSFDLSSVTNRILSAELCLTPRNDNDTALKLQLAPMVYTSQNAGWKEGAGSRGAQGRNAMSGEATFSRCAYPDVAWERSVGVPSRGLDDSALWMTSIATTVPVWKSAEVVRLKLNTVSWLEKIRSAQKPVATFGLWGSGGKGFYIIASKESGQAPVLVLVTEDAP